MANTNDWMSPQAKAALKVKKPDNIQAAQNAALALAAAQKRGAAYVANYKAPVQPVAPVSALDSRISTDPDFVRSELIRTNNVIAARQANNQDTTEQGAYLNQLQGPGAAVINPRAPIPMKNANYYGNLVGGVNFDEAALKAKFDAATRGQYDALGQQAVQDENQFGSRTALAGRTALDNINKGYAMSIATGASRGVQAASQLSQVLGLQQMTTDDASVLAQNRYKLQFDEAAALAANAPLADTTMNARKLAYLQTAGADKSNDVMMQTGYVSGESQVKAAESGAQGMKDYGATGAGINAKTAQDAAEEAKYQAELQAALQVWQTTGEMPEEMKKFFPSLATGKPTLAKTLGEIAPKTFGSGSGGGGGGGYTPYTPVAPVTPASLHDDQMKTFRGNQYTLADIVDMTDTAWGQGNEKDWLELKNAAKGDTLNTEEYRAILASDDGFKINKLARETGIRANYIKDKIQTKGYVLNAGYENGNIVYDKATSKFYKANVTLEDHGNMTPDNVTRFEVM